MGECIYIFWLIGWSNEKDCCRQINDYSKIVNRLIETQLGKVYIIGEEYMLYQNLHSLYSKFVLFV